MDRKKILIGAYASHCLRSVVVDLCKEILYDRVLDEEYDESLDDLVESVYQKKELIALRNIIETIDE